ncbi:MAG: GNAT family N-acetyltransferase [Alkalinema sp. CACIAM 70d]|nr:MAG: GNAT family N-acetyltransferase [Alkalinema sp. CACIAM 70d]
MDIRLFTPKDTEQIAQLFHDTVRTVNRPDYSLEQVQAWAPENLQFRNWAEVCADRFTYVADDKGVIAGFGELEANGHIDCFYCHRDYQRCGVGRQIYQAIERKALELSLPRLFVESSITAKLFFEAMGFSTICQQQVSCRSEIFVNYRMEKVLSDGIKP